MSAALIVTVIATLGEAALWWAAAAGFFGLAFAFVLHLLLSTALAFNAFAVRSERTAMILIAAGTLFMGPFGAMGAVAMALFALAPGEADFASFRRSLGPDGDSGLTSAPRFLGSPGGVLISFHDVMRWGARNEKQAALRRMAERYSPAFAGALKLAMRDPIPEVRSEASAAANAILAGMEARARSLAGEAARNGGDRTALIAYGDAELEIARSGLPGARRAAAAQRAALAAYDEAKRIAPDDPALRLKSALALQAGGALLEAARESGVALGMGALPEKSGEDALLVYLETLFALGRYGEIRQILSQSAVAGTSRRAATLWRRPVAAVPTQRGVRHRA